MAVRALPLALLVLLAGPGAASAAAPSVIDTSTASAGRSVWTYSDLRDSSVKYEGGYARFDEVDKQLYASSPHGGYDTTGDDCKVCHAVHRSEGAYTLGRAQNQTDACVYCHVGSAHSSKTVYDSDPDGTSASVGHTIGGDPLIPASSTRQSLETTTMTVTDSSGDSITAEVTVRVSADQNMLFSMRRNHGHQAAGAGRRGYMRIGPTSLTCMSCHQVHGAPPELWRPASFPDNGTPLRDGYKLLRRNPSGSIYGPDGQPYDAGGPATVSYSDGMEGYTAYTDHKTTGLVNATATVNAVESTITPENSGEGETIWRSPEWHESQVTVDGPAGSPTGVNQYALSAWCADCHNLAIGSFGQAFSAEATKTHGASATHASPMQGASNGPGQCYTCHRAGLESRPATATYSGAKARQCEVCHYGTGSYALDARRNAPAGSDFPHSAETSSAYMLGSWTVDESGSVEATRVTEANVKTTVCTRCHREGGTQHGHAADVASSTIEGTFTAEWTQEPIGPMTYSEQECGQCHLMDVREEHAKSTSVSATASCAACHPEPRKSVGDWKKTCQEGDCHPTFHDAIETKHEQITNTCGGSRCHPQWSGMQVAAVHDDAWRNWTVDPDPAKHPYVGSGTIPRNGCALCHTSPVSPPPIKTRCRDCHAPHRGNAS